MVDKLVNPIVKYTATQPIVRHRPVTRTSIQEPKDVPFGIRDRVSISKTARMMYQYSQVQEKQLQKEHGRLLSYAFPDVRPISKTPELTYSNLSKNRKI